jgi:cytochrome d ubiquinol oxidase subunit II
MYDGTLVRQVLGLLNPFALLVGVVSLSMLLTHGARLAGPEVRRRDRRSARGASAPSRGLSHGGLRPGGAVAGRRDRRLCLRRRFVTDGPSNPLHVEVDAPTAGLPPMPRARGSSSPPCWASSAPPWPSAACGRAPRWARCLWSKLGIFGMISTVGLTMFPFILPSTVDPNSSLTVWDSSART